jgi:proline racemase
MHRRGQGVVGETRGFRSITGGVFEGRITAAIRAGPHPAVVTEVAGRAYHTGEARFTVEPDDPLAWGFLLGR